MGRLMPHVLVLWLLAGASVAHADDEAEARNLFRNGTQLYDEGRYEEAIVAFDTAYALSERPALLFNVASAYKALGNFDAALVYLNRYRVYAPPEEMAELTALAAELEALAAATPAEPPDAEPEPTPTDPPPAIPPAEDPPSVALTPRRRTAPVALTSAGGVLAVVGGTTAAWSWTRSRQHVQAGDQEAWLALKPVNNVAVGAGIAGGTMVLGGLGWALLTDGGVRVHVGQRTVGLTLIR